MFNQKNEVMNFNEIIVRKLSGEMLTAEESQFFAANAAKIKEMADAANEMAAAAAEKQKFTVFFEQLKEEQFESFDDFFEYVKPHVPRKVRGTTTPVPLTSISNLKPNSYNWAIVETLKNNPKGLLINELIEKVEILLPEKAVKYVGPRVRYGLKNQLVDFITVSGETVTLNS